MLTKVWELAGCRIPGLEDLEAKITFTQGKTAPSSGRLAGSMARRVVLGTVRLARWHLSSLG